MNQWRALSLCRNSASISQWFCCSASLSSPFLLSSVLSFSRSPLSISTRIFFCCMAVPLICSLRASVPWTSVSSVSPTSVSWLLIHRWRSLLAFSASSSI
ncbi:hypothetical protein EYF80_052784 [Liparis tanakae]|uniref:Uncharacterized protein n=1 Tax=Liparis tanakae TaxID=230148 RepID=A0A4Z2F8A5_9TELE|nr:hypothetical protein EYF80_052784 [Liparis tanakae]